jgi:protein-L-isoaspartate(D-aspartate) O-methyltransferase
MDPFDAARQHMLEFDLRRRGIVLHSVLDAMNQVPRHLFVSPEFSNKAYADEALPSSDGQTISQPYMVAAMTQELAPKPGHKILELGTGTGYQTAILAHLVGPTGHIFTIERVPALAASAQRRLAAMGYNNISYFTGDGSHGWPQHLWEIPDTPPAFDRILVTAAAPEVPPPLLTQLSPNEGLLLIPLENPDSTNETLTRIERRGDTRTRTPLFPCRFVPLLGQHAYQTAPQKPTP